MSYKFWRFFGLYKTKAEAEMYKKAILAKGVPAKIIYRSPSAKHPKGYPYYLYQKS